MLFVDAEHEKLYHEYQQRMRNYTSEFAAVAYLLAMDVVTRRHADEIYDFKKNAIKPDTALRQPWQTDSSRMTTRLAYNLWNGYAYTRDEYGDRVDDRMYSPYWIFCNGGPGYTKYYIEAIKIRFGGCYE